MLATWRHTALCLALALLGILAPGIGRAQPVDGFCANKAYDGRYCLHTFHGWTVFVSAVLVGRSTPWTRMALAAVEQQLKEAARVLPAARLDELRRISIWISDAKDRSTSVYHPAGSRGPRESGRPETLMGSIEIRDPHAFVERHGRHPTTILHELAHAYHDQVLGNTNERVLAAFRNAENSGLYRLVKRTGGSVERAYALTNHLEYFAELSVAYFATSSYFPFQRRELRDYDSAGFETIRASWEDRPTMTESPIDLSAVDPGCSLDEPPRSRSTREAARLVVRNRSSDPVELFWIDYKGERKSYARLGPGALRVQGTFTGHVWLVADRLGQCRAIFMPNKDGSYVILTK